MTAGRERVDALIAGPASWSALEHLEETTSTNDEVVARVRAGARAGLVVVADHQTAGRGRAGRDWQDRPGGSLLFSVAVGVPPTATLVPLAAGLAVSDALRRLGLGAELKWPNDVLVAGRKCAGILAESHELPSGTRFLVIGIGIDVDWRGLERAGEQAAWTSVAEMLNADVDRWDLLADVLRSLEAWLLDVPGDPTRLLAAYRVRCATLGREVRVTTPSGSVEGRAVDIDRSGGLIVDVGGVRRVVVAGDVEAV